MAPRAADPVLHDRLLAELREAGYRFRAVDEAPGPHPRDVLLAVAENRGVTVGPSSTPQVAGELGALVTGCELARGLTMPPTVLAWPSSQPPRLDGFDEGLRAVADALHDRPASA